jgi:hypothetical protein
MKGRAVRSSSSTQRIASMLACVTDSMVGRPFCFADERFRFAALAPANVARHGIASDMAGLLSVVAVTAR